MPCQEAGSLQERKARPPPLCTPAPRGLRAKARSVASALGRRAGRLLLRLRGGTADLTEPSTQVYLRPAPEASSMRAHQPLGGPASRAAGRRPSLMGNLLGLGGGARTGATRTPSGRRTIYHVLSIEHRQRDGSRATLCLRSPNEALAA
jgi:hypothetical protein